MKFKLMTPERTLFEGEAVSVSGRAPGGDFQILEGHGTWVSSLGMSALHVALGEGDGHEGQVPSRNGTIRSKEPDLRANGSYRSGKAFAVHGGVIEVTPESVLVLANLAEAADEIDGDRAEGARERAAERIMEHRASEGVDVARARRALSRADARLRASART